MMSSTVPSGTATMTPPIASSSLSVGMTSATRGWAILLGHPSEAPAQSAACAGGRRLVAQQSAAKFLIARPVPDLPQALLGGISQGEAVITAHREWRDAARNRAPMRGEIHQAPRAPAQRPGLRLVL